MVCSTIAMAAGAVMYWAATSQGHGFRLSTVGVILMIVGAIGFIASANVLGTSRCPTGGPNHTYDREVTDSEGGFAAVHEEVREWFGREASQRCSSRCPSKSQSSLDAVPCRWLSAACQ